MSYGDNPIGSEGEDRLNRKTAVAAMRALLDDPDLDTPIAIGIYGEWGSGKTSVMRMLMEALPGDPLRLWFDAWKYARQEEALWRALMLAVVDALRGQLDPDGASKAFDELEESLYRSRTSVERGDWSVDWRGALPLAVRAALGFVPAGKEVFDNVKSWFGKDGNAKEVLDLIRRDEIERYRAQVQSLEQFHRTLADLVRQHVTDGGQRLYLFVDDLDRCLPEDAVGTLEAIKLFLDIPGCVFVLGMDRAVVEQGIRVRYKEFALDPAAARVQPVDARQYLDKIIQIPFTLPPLADTQIAKFVEDWCGEHGQDALKEAKELIVKGVAPNPRSVKRTLNVLRLMVELRKVQDLPVDQDLVRRLAKIVVLQTSYDQVYRDIVADPGLIKRLEDAAFNPAQKSPARDVLNGFYRLDAMLKVEMARFTSLSRDELADLVYLTRVGGDGS